MFIKTTRAHGREYIKLVESYKENGKSRHRVLYNFGRADMIKQDESFLRIVRRLCEVAGLPSSDENFFENGGLGDCSEATMLNYGYLAYRKLWEDLGIQGCLEEIQHLTKVTYSLPNVAFLMAVQHLLEPRSKLSTYENQRKYFNMDESVLHQMYRALDKFSEQKEHIETGLFQYNYIRLNKTVDVVFYDVTTISFESVIADELRNFGFSKECKFNEVQVVLGMIIDSNGIPVGYELFPGNTFDGKTMVKALENIKKRFGINRVIIVADRGINSKMNLSLIKEANYGYIVASKIKGMSAKMQDRLLDPCGFVTLDEKNAEQGFRYKSIEYENIFTDENGKKHVLNENLVITYSPKRAKKDSADRVRLVEKAEKLLENPEKINALNKRGGKKYIDRIDPKKAETWKLAADKIEKDAKFDGFYGIQSSETNLSPIEIVDAYSMLWKIEESFRIMKSTLEIQPVFLWNEERIKGHFVVCFLAFLMERTMELLLANATDDDEVSASPEKIREALNSMQLAAVTTSDRKMLIKTKPTPLAKKIFKMLKLPTPANISTNDDLSQLYRDMVVRHPVQMSLL